jgi:uncharacterized membrane protein
MLTAFKKQGKFNEAMFLGIASIFCFSFSVFRLYYTGSKLFLFLNWNLFLAFIPWFFSSLLIIYPILQKKKLLVFLVLGIWLLFFPNAPYILTDLFHLKRNLVMPIWFDLLLILSFAWTGLMYGFISLWNIEKVLKVYFNNKWVTFVATSLLFVGSFGIYLGRYLRWNSWDIIQQPLELVYDIGDHVISPFKHPTAWGMTIFMGVFLNIIYWSFKVIKGEKGLEKRTNFN